MTEPGSGPATLPKGFHSLLDRIPGPGSVASAELVYQHAVRYPGILVLISPTPRTAVAAALSAAANAEAAGSPSVYLLDFRQASLTLLLHELAREDLAEYATFYHGGGEQFFRDIPLTPSMLCIDSASAGNATFDPAKLTAILPPDLPVLRLESGTPIAFQAAEAQYRRVGFVPSPQARRILQGSLHERYFLAESWTPANHTPVADVTVDIRREFARLNPTAGGYASWPYLPPLDSIELPPNLPSGKPWPRISIVTPSFNQGGYIEETLLSVLHQNYPSVEHIVVDGASTDGTSAILDRYRDRLAHTISEPDNGQSHAINKGMALATGEILTWLNSDDMLAPGALAAVALAFDTNSADMIAGICRLYRDGRLEAQHMTSCAEGPLPLEDLLDLDHGWNAGQFFYQPEVMFTRELWLRAGGYVNDWLHYSMDYEMWLRFAEAGAQLHVIGRPVAWFRLHDQQKTHITARFQAELLVCRRDFLKRSGREEPAAVPAVPLRQKLRVTLLNDIGPFFGAGIAHVRMARALAWAGHEITLVSILDRSLIGFESTGHYTSQAVIDRVAETNPDLVIIGNLHAANADPFLLQLLCERFPSAVVLHDYWALTGRCAFPAGCDRYLAGCDHTCPTPNEYPALPPEQIADAWSSKRLIFGEAQGPAILCSTRWAAELARNAFAANAHELPRTPPIARFQLSFPLHIFRSRDRRMCRDNFDLPYDRFVILLAGAVEDPRKGGRAFLEALGRLELPNLLVATMGRPDPGATFPVEVRQLGQINGQDQVAMINSAADLVVAPATEETFGQTFIEAIACGTPVLGYPINGIRGAIRDGVTGLLSQGDDPASLAAAVQYLYAHPGIRRDLSRWGRLFVENEWSEFAASRHLLLSLRAIDDGRVRPPHNLRFLPAEPAIPPFHVVARCLDSWRPQQGFSQMEFAIPEHHLPPYRWLYGPGAIAELFAEAAGLHRVLIAYRNPHQEQRLGLRCNGTPCGSFDLHHTGIGTGRMLVVNVPLEAGANFLQLEVSQWDRNREDLRPLALIVTEILLELVAACDRLARQTSAAEMLASAWGDLTP
uniref:Glycosyl transferase, family 2 n=1 Tax=Solibacter usitatus (strain Ellin6076) TaxID=234267 RepID=Q02BE2_SOLUE